MNQAKRIIFIKRFGRVERLGRKAAYSKYLNLLYYYDTPQGVDDVERDCRFIMTAIDEGYNYIDVDEMIKTY